MYCYFSAVFVFDFAKLIFLWGDYTTLYHNIVLIFLYTTSIKESLQVVAAQILEQIWSVFVLGELNKEFGTCDAFMNFVAWISQVIIVKSHFGLGEDAMCMGFLHWKVWGEQYCEAGMLNAG